MELRLLNIEEGRKVYNTLMVNDFPQNELKPYEKMLSMLEDNRYYMYGVFEGEEFLGYAYVVNEKRLFMLDYFAIVKEQRGSGVGSKALGLLKEKLKEVADVLLIESENPLHAENEKEKKTQENRLSFYLKNGCVDTGVKTNAFYAEYNIMAIINTSEEVDIKDAYSKIYFATLSKDSYDKFIKIY